MRERVLSDHFLDLHVAFLPPKITEVLIKHRSAILIVIIVVIVVVIIIVIVVVVVIIVIVVMGVVGRVPPTNMASCTNAAVVVAI